MVRGQCSLQADKVHAVCSNLQLDLRPRGSINRQIRRHYPSDELLRQLVESSCIGDYGLGAVSIVQHADHIPVRRETNTGYDAVLD